MTIQIIPTQTDGYIVNGKNVQQDMEDTWIAKPELNDTEAKFFREYLHTIENVKSRVHATYKV